MVSVRISAMWPGSNPPNLTLQYPLVRGLSDDFGKTRNDTVQLIVREWMEKNVYLPVHMLDEDGDVGAEA